MEEVRVCRVCGHIDPADHTGRCSRCGLYVGLAVLPRPEAEQLARRRWWRFLRHRVIHLLVALALLGGAASWVAYALFDVGLTPPPRPTTRVSANIGPHTWALVRRTPQQTGFTPDAAPFPHHVAWRYGTAKPLLASPAVVENHVYLTTADGRALALARHTGELVWEYRTGKPSSSTPAVAGHTVIVAFRPGLVVALHRQTGAQLWQTDLQSPILASPVVMHGTVYIGTGNSKLYALDAATGRRRWTFTAEAWIVSAVAYAGDRVLVASQTSRLHALEADTGRRRLVYATGLGRYLIAGPAIQGERAYFGTLGGRVWAIDWQATTYPIERAIWFWKTNLYMWGILSKLPLQKGSVWATRIKGDVTQTPALAHNTVYVTTSKGKVIALEAATGSTQWTVDIGVVITAAPIVAGTVVLIGTEDGTVFGLQAHTGETLWRFKTAGKITGSPIVVDNTMYVVSHDGTLYAVTDSQ